MLRALGAAGGLRRAGSAGARGTFTRWQELAAEWTENVDHQRRIFRSLYGIRKSGWREVFGVSCGARDAGIFHRRGRKQDGDPRQFDGATVFRKRGRAQGKFALRDWARAHRGFQHAERGAVFAGSELHGRSETGAGAFGEVLEGADGVRQVHLRIRAGRDEARAKWRCAFTRSNQ